MCVARVTIKNLPRPAPLLGYHQAYLLAFEVSALQQEGDEPPRMIVTTDRVPLRCIKLMEIEIEPSCLEQLIAVEDFPDVLPADLFVRQESTQLLLEPTLGREIAARVGCLRRDLYFVVLHGSPLLI